MNKKCRDTLHKYDETIQIRFGGDRDHKFSPLKGRDMFTGKQGKSQERRANISDISASKNLMYLFLIRNKQKQIGQDLLEKLLF